ncbi:Uncharacterised protein [Mycobacteroides abscessus subsp. bolletii]|nr:Uncharacterised protein [Mycobacteroides abscessus subsp. bolletii]SKS02854.1 Uncharacterised protein [Mycobacteroides abscessus subsp. bolletii]
MGRELLVDLGDNDQYRDKMVRGLLILVSILLGAVSEISGDTHLETLRQIREIT